MRIFVLICNFVVPLMMIVIGILYKYRLYEKIDKILDLFMPIAMTISGVEDDRRNDFSKNANILNYANRKCSLIWNISGICTLLLTIIGLILNQSNVLSTFTISDIGNVSIILLEVELAIMVAVFISVEYVLKIKILKEVSGEILK